MSIMCRENYIVLYCCMHSECQTLKIISQICLIFNFNVFLTTSLAQAKGLFKISFGHNYFIGELIIKILLYSSPPTQKFGFDEFYGYIVFRSFVHSSAVCFMT